MSEKGCKGCKYEDRDEDEPPCVCCSRITVAMDYYKYKDDED